MMITQWANHNGKNQSAAHQNWQGSPNDRNKVRLANDGNHGGLHHSVASTVIKRMEAPRWFLSFKWTPLCLPLLVRLHVDFHHWMAHAAVAKACPCPAHLAIRPNVKAWIQPRGLWITTNQSPLVIEKVHWSPKWARMDCTWRYPFSALVMNKLAL